MTARERRRVVEYVQAAYDLSERRAIRFTGFPRSTVPYRSLRDPQDELRARIRELAGERPRWGYRRIHVLLRREGWPVNHKRVQRIYPEEGLAVREKASDVGARCHGSPVSPWAERTSVGACTSSRTP